ncbi:MAG: patatin-like phospholipase family protein [Leptospira sp.]|nr:patatin-like phospholipase family protein [Leptospira sp.]
MNRIRKSKNPALADYLTLADLFRTLPHSVLREMMTCTSREFYTSGQILFKQGDEGNDLYILSAGKLRYEKFGNDGSLRDMGEFKRLDLIGELSLFTGEKRSATVRALRDSEVIRVPKDLALPILTKYPDTLLQITKIIAERLAHAKLDSHTFITTKRTFSFISSLSDEKVSSFIHHLGLSILPHGSFYILDEKTFLKKTEELSDLEEKDREPWLIRFFTSLESEYDYVFFLIGDGDITSQWVDRALRQADSLLFIKDAEDSPQCIRLESKIAKEIYQGKSKILVLVQPDRERVKAGTINHLRQRRYDRFFHVHLERPDSWNRLARGILGSSLGLALGGGAAKGFAHLGVLLALEENQIPIDMVAGTSAGAIFAALIAMGFTAKHAETEAKKLWVDRDILNEYTVPVLSLTTGKKYTETIQSFFGDIQIEDLWIPFYAIATDLSHSEIVVLESGPLWKAIRATTSIPGVVPPFMDDGVVYVDGGVLDNVPGLPLKDRGAGKIIAVDVFGDIYPDQDKEWAEYFDDKNPGILTNPLRQVTNLINFNAFLKPKFPPIGDIIVRSILASSRERIRLTEKKSDLFLQIPTNNFGILDWFAYDRLIELGYISSKDKISKFKNLESNQIYRPNSGLAQSLR